MAGTHGGRSRGASPGLARALRGSLLLLACAQGACTTTPEFEGPPPIVELRLAEFEAREGFQALPTRQGETIWVAPEPVVDLGDFRSALIRRQGDDDFLLLNVKAGSRIRLDAETLGHLERPVAFMLDGVPVYVPVLRTSISRQVPVRIGPRGVTPEEAQRILAAVSSAANRGPG